MPDKKKTKDKTKTQDMQTPLIGLCVVVMAVIFMPTTILLFFGMLPTVVAGVIDRTGKGTTALTVGAMNIAGCAPFLLELWTKSHDIETAMIIISDPRAIIVIYCAATVGYMIDWVMYGIVRTLMVQRFASRMKQIRNLQNLLVERWGEEVSGKVPLDAYGFPLASAEAVEENVDESAENEAKPDDNKNNT